VAERALLLAMNMNRIVGVRSGPKDVKEAGKVLIHYSILLDIELFQEPPDLDCFSGADYCAIIKRAKPGFAITRNKPE